jgi:tetratricopeptide (TPR) repeat protein
VTDHRILRDPSRAATQSPGREPRRPDETPLVDHHWGQMTEEERLDAGRDLGIASAWVAQRLNASPPLAKAAATHALPLLEAAVRDRPDDLPAVSSLGIAFQLAGRVEDSLRAFESALRIEPDHELSLRFAGRLQGMLGRGAESCDTARKTIAVNPWRSDYRLALARFSAQAGDWTGAVAACREAIRLNPDWLDARSFLVECLMHAGDRESADAEFQRMLRFYPASRDIWLDWYEKLKTSN